MKKTFLMAFEKTTPGTNRYMEVDDQGNQLKASDGANAPTIYFRKDMFDGGVVPKRLKITVEAE